MYQGVRQPGRRRLSLEGALGNDLIESLPGLLLFNARNLMKARYCAFFQFDCIIKIMFNCAFARRTLRRCLSLSQGAIDIRYSLYIGNGMRNYTCKYFTEVNKNVLLLIFIPPTSSRL